MLPVKEKNEHPLVETGKTSDTFFLSESLVLVDLAFALSCHPRLAATCKHGCVVRGRITCLPDELKKCWPSISDGSTLAPLPHTSSAIASR
jgi:hypothetical protein